MTRRSKKPSPIQRRRVILVLSIPAEVEETDTLVYIRPSGTGVAYAKLELLRDMLRDSAIPPERLVGHLLRNGLVPMVEAEVIKHHDTGETTTRYHEPEDACRS